MRALRRLLAPGRDLVTAITVGFIGVGRLGLPLAQSLLADGHQLVIPARGRSEELVAQGAVLSEDGTCRAVAKAAEVVFCCLPSVGALEQAMTGDDGVLAAGSGPTVFEMSTLPIETKRMIRDLLVQQGGDLMDAPVSGTPPMAAAKIAVIYSSGTQSVHDRYQGLLKAMSPASVYVGEFGGGTKMKYIAQFLATVHVTAAVEAMVLAELAGMDLGQVASIISASPGAVSGQFQIRAPMIANRRFEGQLVTVEATLKDVSQVIQFAADVGAPTDLLQVVSGRYNKLAEAGELQAEPAKLFAALLAEAGKR
jgi:L-threonate 2-dehydrogenase